MVTVAAAQAVYEEDLILAFQRRQALLVDTTTQTFVRSGQEAIFVVNDDNGDEALTRGVNGLLSYRQNNNTQPKATLAEWHDPRMITDFNAFASQGDQRMALAMQSRGSIARRQDKDIIDALSTGTLFAGTTAATASVSMVMRARTILQNQNVAWDGMIYGAITPAFLSYLETTANFSSKDYVNDDIFPDAPGAWKDSPNKFSWMGINWTVHTGLPGAGTNDERCFLYHKSAIGHACDSRGVQAVVGYNDEQDYYYARTKIYCGTVKLQNSGIVTMKHDGSAYVATGES